MAVSDLDRSVAFYQALLGAEPVVRDESMRPAR
ncbi:VOC family protein [Micromonospora arborensis]